MPAAARLTLACAVVAALLLTACGGGSASSSSTGSASPPPESAKATPQGGVSRAPGGHPAGRGQRPPGGDLCQSQVGGFLGSMDSLRRRLAVGVTYEQYVDEIHAVRSTYRAVPTAKLQVECVSAVGIPAEKAFNRYIEAANDWGECVSEPDCGSAEIEPVLQRRWRIASHFLSEAQEGLRAAD